MAAGTRTLVEASMGVERRTFRAAVLLFFTASGATSLVLEVAWTRILGVVFGNTVLAASTVLTAFMLGLALGSAVLGRVADRVRRALLLYGCLEMGTGTLALLFPVFAAAVSQAYGWYFRAYNPSPTSLNLVRLGFSLALLVPPAFLMGGTLPVLGRHLAVWHREPGQEVGYLYGANTVGGVAGSFLAGFVLLAALGVHGTLVAAGCGALVVGVLAAALGLRAPAQAPAAPQPQPEPPRRPKKRRGGAAFQPADVAAQPLSPHTFRMVALAFAITGFCAMACEILWTRVLLFLLTTTVYAFASMLTTFLTGIALGSFMSARFLVPRIRRPVVWFGAMEVLIGLSTLVSVPVLADLERLDARIAPHLAFGGVWQFVLTSFADAFLVMLPSTLLMGAVFPVVTAGCLRGEEALGRRLGHVYAANTVGCVLGSLLAGFVMLPLVGTHHSILAVVALNLAVGVALVWHGAARSAVLRYGLAVPLAAVAVAAFALTPADVFYRVINAYHQPSRISFIKESPAGTVTVHDLPNGERLISVDGVDVAGLDFMLRSTQKLQAYIPLLLHPNPRRVVQIGFGSGETARVGMELGIKDYTVVEICPAVFDAGRMFRQINHGSYQDPRIHRVIMDGKNWALLSNQKYDVVMNDSVFPGSSGSSALYTVDHFRNCRNRLAPGGLFSCWVPLDLRASEMRMILKSFQKVFPHTSFWVASNCVNKHGLILGSLQPLRIDFRRLQRMMAVPSVRSDLAEIAIPTVYDFLDCHMCDERTIQAMVADAPDNTDDRPRLEFSCAIRIPWERRLWDTLIMLTQHRAPVTPYVVNLSDPPRDREELARRYRATTHIFRAQIAQLAGLPRVRGEELLTALREVPGDVHVHSCQAELLREIGDLRQACAMLPGVVELRRRLADKLYVAAQYQEAGELYDELLKANPNQPSTVYLHLAVCQFTGGDAGGAESTLAACLKAYPQEAEAHDLLAGLCRRYGRLSEAKAHIQEAMRLRPDNPLYREHARLLGVRVNADRRG